MKKEFIFDKNYWCVKNTPESFPFIKQYMLDNFGYKTDGAYIYYGDTGNPDSADNYFDRPWGTVLTLEQFKQYILMENRKIIGYKAPFDFCGGNVKKGDIFKRGSCNEWYYGLNGDAKWQQPKEIVETWEPIYEPLPEKKTVKIGTRDVVLTSKGVISGISTYMIKDWTQLYWDLTRIILYKSNNAISASKNYDVKVETFTIGCESGVTLAQVKNLIETYYELNRNETVDIMYLSSKK